MKKKTTTPKKSQPRSPNNAFEAKAKKLTKSSGTDIIGLILQDHAPLKELIETLKDGDLKRADKQVALQEFAFLLTGHAKSEEQSLYAAMKNYKDLKISSFEGDTEHAIADRLVHEINATADDNEWLAKTKVLAELVEHHIEEEESDMLKKVEQKMPLTTRESVGEEYTHLLNEYLQLNEIQTPKNVHFKKVAAPPITSLRH